MIDIDELLDLEAKATPGPWSALIGISDVVPRGEHNQAFDCSNDNAELIVAMRNNIRPLLLELKASRKVVEAAKHHLNYAKEKENCGPCFDYCPNAIDGEADCECGGSMIWYSLKELEGGEK